MTQTITANDLPFLSYDFRFGSSKRLVLASINNQMQIPDEISKCVAFLAAERESGPVVGGTAFFLNHPIEGSQEWIARYLVTAAHVIDEIKARAIDGKVLVRVNSREGDATLIKTNAADWIRHEDDRVDVAICALFGGFENIDHMYLPTSFFLDDRAVVAEGIGPGDDLFFPGLFTRHFGSDRNIPIMRTGTIAAMPIDRVETKWGSVRAYLAEARSIGGFSGSPVFMHIGGPRLIRGVTEMGPMRYYFLGLVHGHFGVNEDNWDSPFNNETQDVGRDEKRSLNMGIAIIIPADDVLSCLNHPHFAEQRRLIFEALSSRKRTQLPELH